MRTIKGTVLLTAGIAVAIVAVGMGDSINHTSNGWTMLAYTLVAIALLATALVLCALGVNAENDQMEEERLRKISRVPTHSNEWRDVQ